MLKFLCILAVLVAEPSESGFAKSKRKIVGLSCDANPDYVNNVTCELKPIKRNCKKMEMSFTIFRPLPTVWIRLRNLRKTSANRYMPGKFDIKQDLCVLMNSDPVQRAFLLNFFETLFKGLAKEVAKNFRKCPFKGFVAMEELIDETEAPPAMLLEPGEYRNEVTYYSVKNITFMVWKINVVLNNL